MRAEVVGTPNADWTDHGKKGFVAHLLETRPATAGTRNAPLIGMGWLELQQLRQGRRSGLMHSGPDGGLDALQIEAAGGPPIAENQAQQSIYFREDLLLDGLRRFFS